MTLAERFQRESHLAGERARVPAVPPTYLPEELWRQDVALELWVDVTSDPVMIQLEGELDRSTGSNLAGVIMDCMADGYLDFMLDTRTLSTDPPGSELLEELAVLIRRGGGRLRKKTFAGAREGWRRR